VQSRDLPEGYALAALIPWRYSAWTGDKTFVLSYRSRHASPASGLARQKLFGAPAPWISTDGFGLLVEEA